MAIFIFPEQVVAREMIFGERNEFFRGSSGSARKDLVMDMAAEVLHAYLAEARLCRNCLRGYFGD